jgi:hypothetical protein
MTWDVGGFNQHYPLLLACLDTALLAASNSASCCGTSTSHIIATQPAAGLQRQQPAGEAAAA